MADNTLFRTGYATDEVTATIAALKDRGVQFLVCANTLRGKQVDPTNDLSDVDESSGRSSWNELGDICYVIHEYGDCDGSGHRFRHHDDFMLWNF